MSSHRHRCLRTSVTGAGRRASVVLVCLLLCALPADAMDIESIQINAGVELSNGVPLFDPYYLDVTVEGREIAQVTVSTPLGCSAPLLQVADGTFWVEDVGYESLAEIEFDCGFGDVVFDLVGARGEQDSVTLFFDPGLNPLFTDYGEAVYPLHLDFDVPLEPTFEWNCVGACNDKDGWDLQVVRGSDGQWAHSELLDPSLRLWTPGPLAPNTAYLFWNHLEGLIGGAVVQATTQSGDDLLYAPTWEILNEIEFDTLENPVLVVGPTQLVWSALSDASSYDLVRGDLQILRSTGGDFTAATQECLAENHPLTFVDYSTNPLESGQGFWFLVRGADAIGGPTYESLYSSQIGTRDDEIGLAAGACF